MVGAVSVPGGHPPAHPAAALIEIVYCRIVRDTGRFLGTAEGQTTYSAQALAELVAEIVAEHTAALHADVLALMEQHQHTVEAAMRLRTGLSEVLGYRFPDGYPGDETALADLRNLAAEHRVRENEIISLGSEVEKLERALSEAARDSETAARFVDTMIGGDRR
jgi:hypothetical protein